MEQLQADGFVPGLLTPAAGQIAQGLEAFGFDPEAIGLKKAATYEAFRSIVQEYTFNLLKSQKGVQTEGDAKRAQEAFLNVKNTPEGNRLIAEYYRRINQRMKERQAFVAERMAPDGSNFRDVQNQWNSYIEANPLFPPKEDGASTPVGKKFSDADVDTLWEQYQKENSK
jgi:hypothetical protein